VLTDRGLCVGLITRPDESYRLWSVIVSDLEISRLRRPWHTGGFCGKKNLLNYYLLCLLEESLYGIYEKFGFTDGIINM